jgi:CDP-paratose 2-epimerase
VQEPFTISGTGKQVRDVLHSQDIVNLYFLVKDCKRAYGEAFNIGGGKENSLSLLELFRLLENKLGISMEYTETAWRESDQKVFIADINKVKHLIGWEPETSKEAGVEKILNWLQHN